MCKTDPTCACQKIGSTFKLNYDANTVKRVKYNNRDTAIVPLVMAISSVVMNGAVIPVEEFEPEAWNGVPVTVGHPEHEDGTFLSANTPESLVDWSVGRVFNAEVKGDKLCAEAYIDVVTCQRISMKAWKMIQAGEPLDVSTGYFADVEREDGVHNGVAYQYIHRELRPDHLALLPEEVGACNWNDGCGVRANKRRSALGKIAKALGLKKKVKNEEQTPKPEETDIEAMVAGIIQSDDSPFTDEDAEGLKKMSSAALKALAATYTPKEEEATNEDDPPAKTDAGSEEPEANGAPMKNAALTAEDREALSFARNHLASHKADLIKKITANSKMTKKSLETFSVCQLTEIANGLVVHEEQDADYGARATPVINEDEDAAFAKAMQAPSLTDAIKNRSKKGA